MKCTYTLAMCAQSLIPSKDNYDCKLLYNDTILECHVQVLQWYSQMFSAALRWNAIGKDTTGVPVIKCNTDFCLESVCDYMSIYPLQTVESLFVVRTNDQVFVRRMCGRAVVDECINTSQCTATRALSPHQYTVPPGARRTDHVHARCRLHCRCVAHERSCQVDCVECARMRSYSLHRDTVLTKHCHSYIADNLMHISDRDDFCDYMSACPGMVKRMLRLYKGIN